MAKINVAAMYENGKKVQFSVNKDKNDVFISDDRKWLVTCVKGDNQNIVGLLTLNNIITLKIDEE